MKNNMSIPKLLASLLICLAFTNDGTAQKKKNRVKRHVKTHHKKQFRPAKARRVAHFRYRHLPKRGRVVRAVGAGHVSIRFGGIHFRFHSGVWYKPRGSRFVVVAAPFGARVRVLPVGYRRIVIGSRPYFYHYGTFYIKTEGAHEEYEVVAAPVGAKVDALPEGYDIVEEKGVEYYKLEDVYYKSQISEANEANYVVVEDPTQ